MNLIDEINVKQYNDKYERGKYICSNCHEITTLNDSCSHIGYNLVCNRCLWRIEHITGIFSLPQIQKIGKLREDNEKERMKKDATNI